MRRLLLTVILLLAGTSAISVDAASAPDVAATKCAKVGMIRKLKGDSYTCIQSGKKLVWIAVSKAKPTATNSTTTTTVQSTATTVQQSNCRTMAQIALRLPNELIKREWESVVARLQPLAASADSSGKTTALIDTFEDTSVGNLEYGRYYPMTYPAAIPETKGGNCAYLSLVLDVLVRFTGSDTSDEAARNGIQAVVKTLLQEVISKHTKVDSYDVDVLLIEPVLDYCPGRQITSQRTMCPWNDVGFLYFRTASMSVAQVAATSASDIFSLGVAGAMFLPRPFTQIVGIGPSNTPVIAGSVRELVPLVNKTHQASTYIEFSDLTSELGQTISVDSNLAVGSITVRTVGQITTIDGRRYGGSGPAIPATVQTRIYKYNGVGEIPTAVRRSDFTKQVDVVQNVTFEHFSSVNFNLPSGVVLPPGKYLITFTVSGWNPTGSYIRMESFAEGSAGQTNAYSSGRAYRACNLRRRIGYRLTDNPSVTDLGTETLGLNCEFMYAEVSKGENPARPMQHTWVWSDLAMTLNAP